MKGHLWHECHFHQSSKWVRSGGCIITSRHHLPPWQTGSGLSVALGRSPCESEEPTLDWVCSSFSCRTGSERRASYAHSCLCPVALASLGLSLQSLCGRSSQALVSTQEEACWTAGVWALKAEMSTRLGSPWSSLLLHYQGTVTLSHVLSDFCLSMPCFALVSHSVQVHVSLHLLCLLVLLAAFTSLCCFLPHLSSAAFKC